MKLRCYPGPEVTGIALRDSRINGGRPDPVQEEALSCSETEHWGPLQYVHAPGHA